MELRHKLFLTSLSVIGIALVLIATSRYGAGVSSDAARNLSTAENLAAGRGFVDMVGEPFVLWPPLYPLLLAGLSAASMLDVFAVAWYLNVLLYGINIWLVGRWLFSIFRDTPLLAIAACVITVFSRSLLRIHANVASEPLFMTFMLVCFLAAARYMEAGSRGSLWLMCCTAGLAALQRYLGVALLMVAATAIIRRKGRRALAGEEAIALLAAALPIALWAVLHNIPISGAPFGPRELGAMLPLQNMGLGLTKMLWWFVPRWGPLDWLVLHPLVPTIAVAGLLAAISRRRYWRAWRNALSSGMVWPALLFAVGYFMLLAFTVVTSDHLDLTSDRYYIILLPVVLAFLFVTLERLVLSRLGGRRTTGLLALSAALALWFVYPLYSVQSYLRDALLRGEPTNYNIANSAQFREMPVVRAAEPILRAEPDAVVYSNYVNIVWFIFDHPVGTLPYQDQAQPRAARIAALKTAYPDWPGKPGYIIWFTPNEYHHIADPSELAEISVLKPLYSDATGQIFAVRDVGD